jgi:16S rRNA (uracil1498-N3)-methyltransferase
VDRVAVLKNNMRRFFIQPELITDDQEVRLDREESRHITQVLRLQPDVAIELYDGTGFLYQSIITRVGKTVAVQIQAKQYFDPVQPAIILHAGLLKNKKMEFVLQKATELGVNEVHLFTSDHTSVPLPDQKKMHRFQKIIQESCKQCERIHPMHIFKPTSLNEQLNATKDAEQRYLFWERELRNDPSIMTGLNRTTPIHLFTGPEGGFSDQEINGLPVTLKTISLGQQILRAETAVITGVSIAAFLAGRFKF